MSPKTFSFDFSSRLLTIFLSVSLLFVLTASCAQAEIRLCRDLFVKGGRPIAGAKPQFKVDVETYTKVVVGEQEIDNQCGLNTCHVISQIARLEQAYAVTHRKPIKLSSQYVMAEIWRERAFEAVDSDSKDIKINLGNTFEDSRETFMRINVIPKEAWTGGHDFHMFPRVGRLDAYLTNFILKARSDRALISQKETEGALTKLEADQKRNEISVRAKEDIAKALDEYTGPSSERFNFRGKVWTPAEFTAKYFPDVARPVIKMNINMTSRPGEEVQKTALWPEENGVTLMSANFNVVEKLIKDVIDSGQAVALIYQHENAYIDSGSGLMSPGAFNIPKNARPLSRYQRSKYGLANPGHQALIVGYELNPRTGRIIKFKVRNTWGTAAGKEGYNAMSRDYFRLFASGVAFFADSKIPLPNPDVTYQRSTAP